MSDRTVQVGMLVVVVALLTVSVLALARLPESSSAPVLGAVVGALVAVASGLSVLISRPSNSIPIPKEKATKDK